MVKSGSSKASSGADPTGGIFKTVYRKIDDVKWSRLFSLDNILDNLLNVTGAVVVLVVFVVVGAVLSRLFSEWAKAQESDISKLGDLSDDEEKERKRALRNSAILSLVGSVLYLVFVVLGFAIMLHMFGLEIATIVAILVAVVVVVSLALQGTFSDVASGLLLAYFQTYDVGDIVQIGDIEGLVIELGVVNTLVEHMSTRALITVPNSTIQKSIVTNFSKYRHHMFVFDVALSGQQKNHTALRRAVEDDLKNNDKYPVIVRHPKVSGNVNVNDLGDKGVVLRVSVPFLVSADLNTKRNVVRNGVLDTLDRLGAAKLDNAYDYVMKSSQDANLLTDYLRRTVPAQDDAGEDEDE